MMKFQLDALQTRLQELAATKAQAWKLYDDLSNRRADAQAHYMGFLRNELDAKDASERYHAVSKAAHSAFECYREVTELFIAAQDALIAAMVDYEQDYPNVATIQNWLDEDPPEAASTLVDEEIFQDLDNPDVADYLKERAKLPYDAFPPDTPGAPTRAPGDIPF